MPLSLPWESRSRHCIYVWCSSPLVRDGAVPVDEADFQMLPEMESIPLSGVMVFRSFLDDLKHERRVRHVTELGGEERRSLGHALDQSRTTTTEAATEAPTTAWGVVQEALQQKPRLQQLLGASVVGSK